MAAKSMMVIHIKGTQHTSKPAIRRDFAHTPTVIDLLSSDDEVDCSALNEECERSAEVETVDGCVVCDQDFTSFSEESKEIHINKCLTSQSRYDALVSGSTSSETVALNGKTFFCVLCDVDLSRRKILSRCWHLKRCMRSKGMDTKTLMQLVSPIDSATDDSESEIEEIAEPVANSSSTRNAWTVLMSSAKQQSQLKGFHATPSTSIKNAEPALLPKKRALPDKENVDNKISKKKFSKPAKAPTEQSGYAPSFKKIQLGSMAVPIVVDGFQYACSALSSCYFLTHFHSDHYQGLSKDFDSGMIYCSKITANLVKAKLRVSISHLTGLDLETKYVLSVGGQDVKVTLIDANHCPGSVCILFYFPSTRRYVLHTGDFRYDSSTMLRTSPTLRQLALSSKDEVNQTLSVYLDTTYCAASHRFPSQSVVIDAVVKAMRDEIRRPGTLLIFGAYTIGKERLFMATAKALGCKIYVDKARWKTLLCLDWPLEDQAMLTTNSAEAPIWVVGMHQINFNGLPALLSKAPQFSRVVGVQPTGWTHNDNASFVDSNDGVTVRRKGEKYTIYSASYSEHSSFSELVDFVRAFKPHKIVPTVNTQQDKVNEQLNLLKQSSGVYDH